MKAYGIPKIIEVKWPDVGDIRKFGLSGGGKDYFGSKVEKARIRRFFKKKARNEGKKMAKELAG